MMIDRRLNLVVPILDEEGKKTVAYVHSTPLAEQTVEAHFLLLGHTFSAIFNQGLGAAAGPGVALRLLKRIAESDKIWTNADGSAGPAQMLVEEIRRLSLVITPGEPGRDWLQLPLDVAVAQGKLSAEDRAEVENAIVFFIAVSATLPRAQRREMLMAACELWGAQLSSSNATAFASSLKTSTAPASTGEKPLAHAPPAEQPAVAVHGGRAASVPR